MHLHSRIKTWTPLLTNVSFEMGLEAVFVEGLDGSAGTSVIRYIFGNF